jgi:hypothetical protein
MGTVTAAIAKKCSRTYIVTYCRAKEAIVIAVLALWLCGLCAVGLYHSMPERGMRQDIYDLTLGILSTCGMVAAATIVAVSLVSPGIHIGKWM